MHAYNSNLILPVHVRSCNGQTCISVMFLHHASTFLTLLHFVSFLLAKLFIHLLAKPPNHHQICRCTHLVAEEDEPAIHESYSRNEEINASDAFSTREESLFNEQHRLFKEVDDHESFMDQEPPLESSPVDREDRGVECHGEVKDANAVEIGDSLLHKVAAVQFDSKKFKLEEKTFGASLTSESTSKSSMEWRSSAIFSDSVTECPLSSSSRRSSSHWENYTFFRKYDEETMFFDRICAQKLTETEKFRSLKCQPRSISQRIVHKLNKEKKGSRQRPYQELECVYVPQICLAWEALSWNYNYFRQKHAQGSSDSDKKSCCTEWIAEQFQQFQVLLQRFIENEPYERGRRPEVFARTRNFSPKFLQVPEFRDPEADELGKEEMVSPAELLAILEDSIRTFMIFLKADKETPCQMLKALIRKKTSSVDPNRLHFLKKANKKSKMTLKDILRARGCLKRQRVIKGKQVMDVLMALIDMKIVSRVLRMPEISQEQLQWCEEKMSKVKVWKGKIQRDSSPLFFPVH
ncbi:uncharacterized protein LOC122017933 isoform X1 [Zingiber officinale]|uniref:uncharacterized protein LOC122017933 isoform X1 n=1 Tax=Zingiber officinale TaxID=94328 RepID=UPI001C4B78F2|nr:uncharacterized protein LOC122017933 isoform X1 [Zingiber officinale]